MRFSSEAKHGEPSFEPSLTCRAETLCPRDARLRCEVTAVVEQQFGIEFFSMWRDKPTADDLKYRHDVRVELRRILCSRAGRALAASLRYQLSAKGSESESKRGKTITLMPYQFGDCGAQEDKQTAGSDRSWVMYTPAARGGACFTKGASALPHEKLFHELVHSLRRVSGHLHWWPLQKRLLTYTDTEEFLAILVTNIFISDITNPYKSRLRRNHATHDTLDRELSDSFRFFSLGTKAFNIIAIFCDENRGFTQMLAHVSAPFNPIAAMYKNRRKAFEIAAQGDADYGFINRYIDLEYDLVPGGVWKKATPYPGPPLRRS